jgi:WD40 repeat protein
MAVSADGEWVAVDDGSGIVQIWKLQPDKRNMRLRGDGSQALSIAAIAPSGAWLATADRRDGMIRVWDPARGRQFRELPARTARMVFAVAPDSSWLATIGKDRKTIWIWESATWTEKTLGDGELKSHVLAAAPDGSWIAIVNAKGIIHIWNVGDGGVRGTIQPQGRDVRTVAVAPDSSWFATVHGDKAEIDVWNSRTCEHLAALRSSGGAINAVSVSADGKWLMTGGEDAALRIWAASTWAIRAIMRVENTILSCAWIGTDRVAVGSRVGLYQLEFLNAE